MLFTHSVTALNGGHGQAIYNRACNTCHNPSAASLMKAPASGDNAAWAVRIEQAKHTIRGSNQYPTVMDYFVETVKHGKGAMVPGGMCSDPGTENNLCTDDDYRAAIQYMMGQ